MMQLVFALCVTVKENVAGTFFSNNNQSQSQIAHHILLTSTYSARNSLSSIIFKIPISYLLIKNLNSQMVYSETGTDH